MFTGRIFATPEICAEDCHCLQLSTRARGARLGARVWGMPAATLAERCRRQYVRFLGVPTLAGLI